MYSGGNEIGQGYEMKHMPEILKNFQQLTHSFPVHPKGCIGNEWVKEMFLMTCFIKERFFVVTFSIAAF